MATAGLLLACGAAPGPDRRGVPTAAPAPPALVVLIVVDQLASWTFERDAPHLRGGIARLLREGVLYPRAALPYAATYTAPGHAALATGAPPALTGIIANDWHSVTQGREVSAAEDPGAPLLDLQGRPRPETGSGRALAVEGLADVLRRSTGGRGRSVSIALKDRSAVFVLGRRPDLAIWYDPAQTAMVTSRAYRPRPPGWLVALAHDAAIAPRLAWEWTPLSAGLLARATGQPDAAPGESNSPGGLDDQFPHPLAAVERPARAMAATPLGSDVVLEAGLAAIAGEALGADPVPDLLALSFSSHDLAGHQWGPDSWERLDLLLRLDRALGDFLAALDRRVGPGRYAVVFTSDHGVTRTVEQSQRAGLPAHRIQLATVVAAAEAACSTVLGPGQWIAGASPSNLHVSRAFSGRPRAEQERALAAAARAIAAIPGIGYAVPAARVRGRCEERRGMDRAACLSLFPGRSGELFFSPAPHSVVAEGYTAGTNHGSSNDADRLVPVIVWRSGRPPARHPAEVSFLRVAPTLARLLDIPAPPAAREPPLPF